MTNITTDDVEKLSTQISSMISNWAADLNEAVSQPGEPGKAQGDPTEQEAAAFMKSRQMRPTCPKCGASMLAMRDRLTGVAVGCNGKETHFFEMKRLEDFAQFFRPPAPSPLPTYEEAKPNIGWGWSGFRINDEDSLKFTFNRMRDAMQKCLGMTELTPIEVNEFHPTSDTASYRVYIGKEWVVETTSSQHAEKIAASIRRALAGAASHAVVSASPERQNYERAHTAFVADEVEKIAAAQPVAADLEEVMKKIHEASTWGSVGKSEEQLGYCESLHGDIAHIHITEGLNPCVNWRVKS